MPSIHSTALVHPGAAIADGASVGPCCVVGPDVVLGEGTVLLSHVVVHGPTVIGRGNQLHPFCVVGADPQDRKYRGESTRLEIGDSNTIREHVTIHRGTGNGGGLTRLGSGNLIMVGAHIAHDCSVGDQVVIANQAMLAGHVRIDHGATISGGVGIHHYASIGTCAFVGGLARISKDVPPFMIVEGSPAEVRGPNRIGMERRGYPERDVEAIKDAYKRLFLRENGRDGLTMLEKMAALRSDYADSDPIRKLCDFLSASADGIHGRAHELSRLDDKRAIRLEALEVEDAGES